MMIRLYFFTYNFISILLVKAYIWINLVPVPIVNCIKHHNIQVIQRIQNKVLKTLYLLGQKDSLDS